MTKKENIKRYHGSPPAIWHRGYLAGIRAAAAFAGEWDRYISGNVVHFEDLILGKFNLIKKSKMRKKVVIKRFHVQRVGNGTDNGKPKYLYLVLGRNGSLQGGAFHTRQKANDEVRILEAEYA